MSLSLMHYKNGSAASLVESYSVEMISRWELWRLYFHSLIGKPKNSCANLSQTSGGKYKVNTPGCVLNGETMGWSSFSKSFLGAFIGSLVHLALERQSNSSVKRAL